jgi:hypothetical protein
MGLAPGIPQNASADTHDGFVRRDPDNVAMTDLDFVSQAVKHSQVPTTSARMAGSSSSLALAGVLTRACIASQLE